MRRARSAFDELFDSGAPVPARHDGGFDRSAPHARTDGDALHEVWQQLARALDGANRPTGRATDAVRAIVRRIARQMSADGASRDEIRGALARAVRRHQRLLGETQRELDVTVSDSLLADVLHCAATEDRARHD